VSAKKSRTFKQRVGAVLRGRLPLSEHVFNELRGEWRLFFARHVSARTPRTLKALATWRRAEGPLLVNVGCGPHGRRNGWANFDACPCGPHVARWDLRVPLPLSAGCAEGIFCEHVLEHFTPQEADAVLRDLRRVLRPGGVLRLIVPDARAYLLAYARGDRQAMARLRPLRDGQTLLDVVNDVFRQSDQHCYAYDEETLSSALGRAGFSRVEPGRFGQSRLDELALDNPARACESLYMEAVK